VPDTLRGQMGDFVRLEWTVAKSIVVFDFGKFNYLFLVIIACPLPYYELRSSPGCGNF
jgi:hypothetical protein